MAHPPVAAAPPEAQYRLQRSSNIPIPVLYALQWGLLGLVCTPLFVLDVLVSLPVAALLWASGAVAKGREMAAVRDPVLAEALRVDDSGSSWAGAAFRAFARCYVSLVLFGLHIILRLFVALGQTKTVFVVYTSNYTLMRKFFCVGTGELLSHFGLTPGSMHPENPWVFLMGIIHCGPDIGFGVYGALCPALSHVTTKHLQALPAAVNAAFPRAESVALAGRLPGIMTAAGVPIKAPIVDGLSGTVFAMEATIRALVANLPPERRARPSVAILGGGGYIGSRLVSVLATKPPTAGHAMPAKRAAGKAGSLLEPQTSFSLEVEPETLHTAHGAGAPRPAGMTATVTLKDGAAAGGPFAKAAAVSAVAAGLAEAPIAFRQIIALDTRYAERRHVKAGVLYTAEPADLEGADVVLVITRNGDDVEDYVKHAQPGQEWGDDTHPEIGRALLEQLAARGVRVHKAMATRSPPTALLPPLPGWPVAGTPGCLLMALVSAATARDWNGAGTGLASGGAAAQADRYWDFSAATKGMGFHAMLTPHRRSKVDGVSTGADGM